METTMFEQTIAMGIAEFIKFLDRTLETGADDTRVSTEIFVPAVALRKAIHDSVEKYSTRMLKIHSIEG